MAKIKSEMKESMLKAMESAQKISTGAFKDADCFHQGSGTATLYALPGEEQVLQLEEFNVTSGPDLHVILSPHPDPASQAEVKGEAYLDLGKLKGNIGNQNYTVPAGTDVSVYRSVVIYCKPFHVIFSVAPLGPASAASSNARSPLWRCVAAAPIPLRGSLAPYDSFPLQRLLGDTARRLPDKVAVIDGDRRFTYAQLDEHSDRLAAALATLGVAGGDRVGVLTPNCAEFEIAFFGIIKAGAAATPVNSGYREREIAHQLSNAGVEVLVVHHSLVQMAESARSEVPSLKRLVAIEEGAAEPESFWGLIEAAPASAPRVALEPREDLAALPYSSGTTGLSKGVMLTHFNLTSNVRQFLERDEGVAIRQSDVILVHLPLFHIYGMNVLMNPAIAAGATQVIMGRFDMEEFLGLLSRHHVTALYSVPPVGLGLAQYPGAASHDLSALRFAMFGAAPMSAEMQQHVQDALGCPVVQGYGLTETSPITNQDFLDPERGKPGSVGPGMADTEERVVDQETGEQEVSFGEPGELLIRGPQVMKGYFGDPEATAEAITADGWLHTGDIVRMDADGYVWILDRKKELIKYKGFQVPPAELEGLLLEHPAVADAAVIAKQDLEAGEVPKAFVVVKSGAGVTSEELVSFVADRVATFKQVRDVEFVEAIPKNPSGKILRRVLLEQERAKARD